MTQSQQQHRPELHFVPEAGIIDAPAGIVRDGDRWHLFHQYRPEPGQPARWGHTYSEETPFAWLDCDDVLAPVGGELSLRAGSVAEGKDALNLYFTSVTSVGTSVRLARYTDYADECIVSDDPTALDPDVVRFGEAVGAHTNFDRFRSPSVVPDWAKDDREEGHDGWLMLALTGHSDAPVPVILDSPNGESWSVLGKLSFNGDPGFHEDEVPATSPIPPVVSPRLVRLRDEVDGEIYDVLFVTLERAGRDVSGYIVGRLDGTEFTVSKGFQLVDFGHDFSRPRNTNTTTGTIAQEHRYDRAVILGLLNGNGRGDDATKHPTWEAEGWANSLSLPRAVTLQGGVLYQTPAQGLPDAVKLSDYAQSWTGVLEVPKGSSVTVTLRDGSGDPAVVIRHTGEDISLDRSMSKAFDYYFKDSAPAVAPLAEGDSDTLTIIQDGASVEVFVDGGLVAMSSRVYFDGGCSDIEVSTEGEAVIEQSWSRTGSKRS